MGTILVVEDEPDIADLVKYHLEKAGLPARVVGDGKQAMELIVRDHPDLVVLDVMMPGMDGYSVLAIIKSDAASRDIPVVMVTAVGYELNKKLADRLGAVGYMTKPVSSAELLAEVARRLPVS